MHALSQKLRIFVSSVQKELAIERRAIDEFLSGDPLLKRYFDVFLFEDLPATDRRADQLYLEEVDHCSIYVGLFGNDYGSEETKASPTEQEFDRATERGKYRIILVKGSDDAARHPKMCKLIAKAGNQLVRRRFNGIPELTAQLYASLVEYLERRSLLRNVPFGSAPCTGASLSDISPEKVAWFLRVARRERHYALTEKASAEQALTHLNLLAYDAPTNSAILLFGRDPQRFLPCSEIKCLHFHGTEIAKPIPSYQIFKGTLFDQVDDAVDFAMSKLVRSVGTRSRGPQVPVEYELPKEAIAEAIVNAVAHRDYDCNAAVQVMIFADRIEIWNPGELPPSLTPERLRTRHPSIPRNPLIAEPLFLAHYVEKAGTGTLDMIALVTDAGLPEPVFEQRGDQFVVTLPRDWLIETVLAQLDLNERQRQAVVFVKSKRRINNAEYQKLTGAIKKTASRDLDDLCRKNLLRKVGKTGRGTYYVLSGKGDKIGTNETFGRKSKGDKKGTKGTS